MSDTAISYAFAAGFFALGLALLAYVLRLRQVAKASMTWPTTEGTITASEVKVSPGGRAGKNYSAAIRYSYQVAGARYEGNTIQFGSYGTFRKTAEALVATYPVGRTVKVHCDPQRPTRTVLVPGVTGAAWTLFLCFCVGIFFVLGVTALVPEFARQ
jgi:hypothetical protein